MYYALYRKYRPKVFDDVVGQEAVVKTLKNSIKNSSFSHAYMFYGPRGVGKTTLSKILARTVNCLNPIDGNVCNNCKNCSITAEKECVDIIEIDAASNNGVDEIRELKNNLILVPTDLKFKVYIIDEVHMLSTGAFNALLKTLEEPPKHVVFILATTDPQKVPDTIVSRCQCFSFKRIVPEIVIDRLKFICGNENIECDDDVLEQIAISCDGGMRDALGMLDKLHAYKNDRITIDDYYEINDLITNTDLETFSAMVFEKKIPEILKFINMLSVNGKNFVQVSNQLMYFLRKKVVDYYVNNISIPYSISPLQNFVLVLNDKMNDLKKSSDPKVFFEMIVMNFLLSFENISREIIEPDKILEKNIDTFNKTSEISDYESKKTLLENAKCQDLNIVANNLQPKNEAKLTDVNIINLNEIMNVRINNILACADKTLLLREKKLYEKVKDYTFDENYGYLACLILDGNLCVASKEGVVFSFEYESSVENALKNIDRITEFYNNKISPNKKIAFITDEFWKNKKNEYVEKVKNGERFEYIEEPQEIIDEKNNDDIISSSTIDLFSSDIIEIER